MKRPTATHEVHDFPATIQNPGTPEARKVHVVACTSARCAEALTIPAGNAPGPYGIPKDAVVRKAVQAGWVIQRKGRSVTCPGCQKPKTQRPVPTLVAMTTAAHEALHRPVFSERDQQRLRACGEAMAEAGRTAAAQLAELKKPRVVVPLDPAVPVHVVYPEDPPYLSPPAAAAAPVQDEAPMADTTPTTPALRRAINAQLHEVHAGGSGYLADWSDLKVAKLLDCAPAAVAAIRADLFGPDTNEEQRRAQAARTTELATIRQQLLEGQAKVASAFDTLADADRLYADALARLANLEGN